MELAVAHSDFCSLNNAHAVFPGVSEVSRSEILSVDSTKCCCSSYQATACHESLEARLIIEHHIGTVLGSPHMIGSCLSACTPLQVSLGLFVRVTVLEVLTSQVTGIFCLVCCLAKCLHTHCVAEWVGFVSPWISYT